MSDKEKQAQAFLDSFDEFHTCIIQNCIGLYLFEKGIKFDMNKKLILLDKCYDLFQKNSDKSYVAMPVYFDD